jgi:hypothetical protein
VALAPARPLRSLALVLRLDATSYLTRPPFIAPDVIEDLNDPQIHLASFHIDAHHLHVHTIP